MRTRERSETDPVPRGKLTSDIYAESGFEEYNLPIWKQRTSDISTPIWNKVEKYRKGNHSLWTPDQWKLLKNHDFGHEFRSEIINWKYSHPKVFQLIQGTALSPTGTYAGPLTWPLASFSLNTELQMEGEEHLLWTLGAGLIAKTMPKPSEFDLGQALGEIRKDGLPRMVGSIFTRSQTAYEGFKALGDEYLNYQFGWAPLLRDVQNLAKVISNSRKILEQRADSVDKLLKRSMILDPVVTTNVTTGTSSMLSPWGLGSTMDVPSGSSSLRWEQTETTKVETWFSGAYRFFFPDVPEGLEYLAKLEDEANTLLGTRLDPELLYNLAPWTWMMDWFVNFGDPISNLTSLTSDHVNIHHAYIMRRTTVMRERTTVEPITLKGRYAANTEGFGRRHIGRVSNAVSYQRKVRYPASPFGFGLTFADLTPYQQAILLSLGISRL